MTDNVQYSTGELLLAMFCYSDSRQSGSEEPRSSGRDCSVHAAQEGGLLGVTVERTEGRYREREL